MSKDEALIRREIILENMREDIEEQRQRLLVLLPEVIQMVEEFIEKSKREEKLFKVGLILFWISMSFIFMFFKWLFGI